MGLENTQISVFKELLKSKDVPYIIPLSKSLERIRVGKSKNLINKVRNAKSKEEATVFKNQLPCIIYGGEFRERNKNGLINHSGLMVVDFDKYPSSDIMNDHFELLKQNKHFVSLFISPSGNGLKGVIKIPISDKFTHEKYFREFNKKFDYEYFDKANCNVDRICFESYDPNIYINYEAKLFNPILIDEGFAINEKVPLIPITSEDKIIDFIMKFDWKKDFIDGQRNNFIFDLAGAFCEYGISKSNAEGYILNNVVIGEFSETEAKTAISSAYKKRSFGTKYFEDYPQVECVKNDLKKGKKQVIEKYKIDEETFNQIKEVAEIEDFWFINEKNKIQIIPLKYKLFLERNGFKKHFPNEAEKPTFVFVESNKVEVTNISKIKDFVLDYLIKRNELDVWNYAANYQNLFSDAYLSMLESIELMMLSDTRDISYIPFQNGILEVSKDKINLIDFIDVNGYIWKSHILNRDFIHFSEYENDYKTFIQNISNKEPFPIECVIGYLISTYKNRSNNKAIILNDEVISVNPEGGTGKGVFVQGISQVRKTSIIDGKKFDGKKSFAYQTVSIDTKILVFDDIKKNYDIESDFSLVTEGITLERKNKDAIKQNVHDSPKLIYSTNYAIKGEGNSHDRRRHEIEIAQYYGKNLTPEDEFKRQLFDDWNLIDFQKFDNYIVYCLQLFLKSGLVKQNAKNIKLRKFIAETNMDFYEWVQENFLLNFRNDKAQYFQNFINDNKDFAVNLKRNTFNIWVSKYATFIDANFEQGASNGLKWFGIFNGQEPIIEDDDIF